MIAQWIAVLAAVATITAGVPWIVRAWRRAPEPKAPDCRLWRLLPYGRQAVHSYCGQLEELQTIPRHLGKRVYVRSLDRVYQWSIGRRSEVDGSGGACVFPVDGVSE